LAQASPSRRRADSGLHTRWLSQARFVDLPQFSSRMGSGSRFRGNK
jgi:hypothetical protein